VTALDIAPLPTTREAATPEPTVVVEALDKRFPLRRGLRESLRRPFEREAIQVLRGVSLGVHPGEFFGLLGPNGAGKTTLFKTLATLLLPDGGRVTVHGHDIVRDAARVREILAPVSTDERSLWWRASARENLALYATLHRLRGTAARARIDETLEVVGLADVGRRPVAGFSSGMKQRLLIARALVARPRVLLLDEPTRSLDPLSARDLRRFLSEELATRQRCTVLLATHNAEEALELCHRVGVLHRGRLLASGSARALAEEFGDERIRISVAAGAVDGLVAFLRDRGYSMAPPASGHSPAVEVVVPREAGIASDLLASLVRGGVAVEQFERVGLSLADLLERVVRARGEEGVADA